MRLYKNVNDIPPTKIGDDIFKLSKNRILLTKGKGRFLKRCPGTKARICCNYHVINATLGCPYDCSYCILQSYLNNTYIISYTNIDDIIAEIEVARKKGSFYRVGTGELGDSLALENITHIGERLATYFDSIGSDDIIFELKTKSSNIDFALKRFYRNSVFAWSVNPPSIVEREEHGSASLDKRINSIKRVIEAGYPIGIHFDPIIWIPNWQREYYNLISILANNINSHYVAWISIGTFRYLPDMFNIILHRFKDSRLFAGEHVYMQDEGKYRYIKPVRREMYIYVVNELKKWDSNIPIYFCMESDEMWKDVFGYLPTGDMFLDKQFYRRIKNIKKYTKKY